MGALAAGALVLAACGGEPEPPAEPPAELLRTAIENPAPSGETTIDLAADLRGSGPLAGELSASLSGPFALDPTGGLPSLDLAVDASIAGLGVDGALISTGEDAFVEFFGETYQVGPERVAAIESRLGSATGGAPGLGLNLASWFLDPRYAGVEEAVGTDTVLVQATLDSKAAAAGLSGLADSVGAPALLEALAAGVGSGPIEAWIALDDKTIRRLRVQVPFTVARAQREAVSGVRGGEVTLQAEIADVGADVAVEPPPGGGFQPIERLIERLQNLASLGGL